MSDKLSNFVWNGDNDGLKNALKGGVDPNQRSYGEETALHCAAERDQAEAIKILIEAGADPNLTSERGDTPLIVGVIHKKPDAVAALLAGGADPEIPNKIGATPLNYVVRMNAGGGVTMTKTIVEDGVEKTVEVDMSPQERAAEEVARKLAAGGANPDAPDSDGCTALMRAAMATNLTYAQILIDAGAKAAFVDGYGFCALHFAAVNESLELATLLMEHGADPSVKAKEAWQGVEAQQSPLDVAVAKGNAAIVTALGG